MPAPSGPTAHPGREDHEHTRHSTRTLAGGNAVHILARDPAKAATFAAELTCDIVVLAVPYNAATALVEQYSNRLDGVVIVDITQPDRL
jgi:8-hydroxy-5-deazaflavin:NADPH oxidoreductase